MTTNIEQQKHFLETIIETDFKEGAKALTNEQLKKIAEVEAERLLQEELETANKKIENKNKEVESLQKQKASASEANNQLKDEVTQLKETNV